MHCFLFDFPGTSHFSGRLVRERRHGGVRKFSVKASLPHPRACTWNVPSKLIHFAGQGSALNQTDTIKKKKRAPEQIIRTPRKVEALRVEGATRASAARQIGVSGQTY